MRTLRLSLVGTVILGLLGGLGGVVLAQGDTDPAKVTPFTGIALSSMPDSSDEEWWVEDGVGHSRTLRVREAVEWSDPRLPSEKQNVVNFDMFEIGEFRQTAMTGTTLLEGPDGYWAGEFTVYCDTVGDCYGTNILTGHGAYEGLFAIFRSTPSDPGGRGQGFFDGLIFEGEMPPMPDPIEPSVD